MILEKFMLQFILGGLEQDHFAWCVQTIHQQLSQKNAPLIYMLVPDHMKFDAEKTLLKQLKVLSQNESSLYAHLNVNVFSFSRLAWALLKDTGALNKPHLSDVGQEMIVRYILMTHKERLTYYRRQVKKQGFIEQLTTLFQTFKRGNVDVSALEKFVDNYPISDMTKQTRHRKMAELTFLYEAYHKAVSEQYLDTNQLYKQLIAHIQSQKLKDVNVYIHGYERFSAIEMQVVEALIAHCANVYITLPLEKDSIHTKQFDALAYITQQTYHHITHFAKTNRFKLAYDIVLSEQTERFSKGMQQFFAFWKQTFSSAGTTTIPYEQDAVMTHSFPTKYEEVEAVAKLIQYYVHEEGYRYNDFYVLMRQVEDYETLLAPIFKESYIPIFFDNATAMSAHPLIELVESLSLIQKRYYQYNDMMRFLRTDLLPFAEKQVVDLLENELLANGYAGAWWFKEDIWENEELRQNILHCLVPFFEKINRCVTMKDAASLLYQFLIDNQVPQTLLQWRDYFINKGLLEQGKKQEQAWTTFVALLDEFVLILGNQPFDKTVFYDVLVHGFEQSEFNLVPASLDAVSVSSVDGKRLLPRKMVFVIGATPTQFPKMYDNKGLLSQEDINSLQPYFAKDSYLDISTNFRTRIEPFVMMNVWVSALERVFIFASETATPSTYMQLINQYLITPPLQLQNVYGVGKMALRHVLHTLRLQKDSNEKMPKVLQAVYEHIQQSPVLNEWYQFMVSSLTYDNSPKPLTNAKTLYQGDLHLSISQLESYFTDPFSHFLRYGLQLKERQTLALSASNIGNVFHSVLDGFHKTILSTNHTLKGLTMEQVRAITKEQLEQTFANGVNRVFDRTKMMQFSKRLIEETLLQTTEQLYRQSQSLLLDTIASEWRFGTTKQIGMLSVSPIMLSDKRKLHLRGIIDRVDANDTYFSVVDYKSSDKSFKLQYFYEGISLQLLLYLYVSSQQLTDKSPVGAFYREINFEYETATSQDEQREPVKQKGIIVAPSDVLQQVDSRGDVYQARFTKDGGYVKNQLHIFDDLQLPILFDYLLLKVKEAGERLLAGDISLSPVLNHAFIPSLNEYRSISLFDATNPTNRYRRFEKIDDIFGAMQQKVGATK